MLLGSLIDKRNSKNYVGLFFIWLLDQFSLWTSKLQNIFLIVLVNKRLTYLFMIKVLKEHPYSLPEKIKIESEFLLSYNKVIQISDEELSPTSLHSMPSSLLCVSCLFSKLLIKFNLIPCCLTSPMFNATKLRQWFYSTPTFSPNTKYWTFLVLTGILTRQLEGSRLPGF